MAQINSYVSDRRKKRQKIRIYLFSVIAFLFIYFIFAGIAWTVLRSPIFRVNQVVIQGNQSVPSADITTLLDASVIKKGDIAGESNNGFKALLGFHNMLVWPDTLPTSDLAMTPQLATISLQKDYWAHVVTVNVTEREPFGIWCYDATTTVADVINGEQCYWFDKTGTIFERAFDTQGSAIPVVHDYSEKARGLNEEILPDEFVPNLISILNVMRETGLTVSAITLPDISLQQINVTIANGPVIYFSLRFPADEDLPVIQNLMGQPGFNKIGYVDATTQNRIYYK